MTSLTKTQLRAYLRKKRQQLSDQAKATYAAQLYQQWLTLNLHQHYQHFACYLAFDGEMPTQLIIEDIWHHRHNCYLPIATEQKLLQFQRYHPHDPLTTHRLGPPEPIPCKNLLKTTLDVILVPLIAFDMQGHRLGFGHGYYDRTLAAYPATQRPLCIGLAYQFQQYPSLPADPWDQPLDLIVTEQQIYYPPPPRQ